ncbi:MAG: hypothetical protein M0P91_06855 [Sulfuricurvum sp.]|jgi:hypothetical protein|uniref:hypothetical protein n=1 Tax=Sulfuricurvum sp. TaxID=2025608 RepID=UPI0025E5F43E|nr:hypothetical protein [Sulfuricurvum sp.]MCK9372900.1 hypothetical protein [Sulfuricurvum sp.]
MQKCTNIEEIARAFDGQKPLSVAERDFYVSIYDDKIERLRTEILINRIPTKTFYVCGQLGNGKSTALAFVPNEKLEEKNSFLNIGCMDLIQEEDTDIVDLLLFVGLKVAEKGGFVEEYFTQLNDLKELNLGKLEQSSESTSDIDFNRGGKVEVGAKPSFFGLSFGASLFAGYKINKNDREKVRRILYVDKTKLKELINTIIHRYEESTFQSEKSLFLILDDLEKIKKAEDIESIFFSNVALLESLECPKIITIPLFAIRDYSTSSKPNLFNLTTRVTTNPLGNEHEDGEVEQNIEALKNIILHRVNAGLITEDAISKAVKMSGGNIRQLINLIYQAAISAIVSGGEKIILQHIEKAVQNLKNNLAMSAANRIYILSQIHRTHKQFSKPTDEDQTSLNNCIKETLVFSYHNGEPWYEVNPLIQKTIEVYSKNSDG